MPLVYATRVMGLPLCDSKGDTIGRVQDLVLLPRHGQSPEVTGIVALVDRRRIFVSSRRIVAVSVAGVTLRSAAVDLREFRLKVGEVLASQIIGRRLGADAVIDLAVSELDQIEASEVVHVAVARRGGLRRARGLHTVGWTTVAEALGVAEPGPVAQLREQHPADAARDLAALSVEERREVAEAMMDEDLADLLEELPEEEQAAILEDLEDERAAHVLEEMEPDDAADLLSELEPEDAERLLEAMDPTESAPLRILMQFSGDTAGGLMNPEALIMSPRTSVAEALARIRSEQVPAALATCVFVVDLPLQPPTGRYRGMLTFQQLLRAQPGTVLAELVDGEPAPVPPAMADTEVAAELASYDRLALPVCDELGRFLGAITVDDVLDHTLPEGWRSSRRAAVAGRSAVRSAAPGWSGRAR